MSQSTHPHPQSTVLERIANQGVMGRSGKLLFGVDALKQLLWEQHTMWQIRTSGTQSVAGDALEYIGLLEHQLAQMKETIAWYANPLNYSAHGVPGALVEEEDRGREDGKWDADQGGRARRALVDASAAAAKEKG